MKVSENLFLSEVRVIDRLGYYLGEENIDTFKVGDYVTVCNLAIGQFGYYEIVAKNKFYMRLIPETGRSYWAEKLRIIFQRKK